jgi:flagellar hook-associated protein FlgK
MNSISATALSGLSAAQLRLDASAHNVANAQTPGFRRQQVVQQAQAAGGVQASVQTAELAGDDLATDLVQQKVALYSFKANLHVLQTEDEMLGSLLDVKA